jgi:dolichyl-phosphate-mannose--protein O-mannosyl transferase
VESFILINYLANWLPWMLVSRCTFLYHALGMVVFSTLALAWLLARWLGSRRQFHRLLAWLMLGTIALSFWFWLPLFLGSPLSAEALQKRWWLPTWI